MNRKTSTRFFIAFAVVLALAAGRSRAQEPNSPKAAEQKPSSAYHLEFVLSEIENGRKINTRQYAMDIIPRQKDQGITGSVAGYEPETKIGTRVPIENEPGKFEYIDIGTRIQCHAAEDEMGRLSLNVRASVSTLVPRSDTEANAPISHHPILRQLEIESTTAITPGKLTSLGTADDPDSKRQFQLEVTATKLR